MATLARIDFDTRAESDARGNARAGELGLGYQLGCTQRIALRRGPRASRRRPRIAAHRLGARESTFARCLTATEFAKTRRADITSSSKRVRTALASYLAALCRTVPYHLVERVLADPTESALALQKSDGVRAGSARSDCTAGQSETGQTVTDTVTARALINATTTQLELAAARRRVLDGGD